MRVAINAWFWNNPSVGSGQYLKYLIPALLQADSALEIILISPEPFDPPPAADERLQAIVAPPPLASPKSNLAKVWFEQVTFPKLCRKLRIDVAHVPYFGSPFSTSVPTIVTIHDLIPMILPEYRGDARVRLYTRLVAMAAQRASLVLADSQSSKYDILRHLKLPDEQVRVVYLAPAPHYHPAKTCREVGELKATYGLPADFILYLGGYDVRKNVNALLRAYAQIDKSLREQYPLVLVGKLPRQASILFPDPVELVRQLKLENSVITPGWIAEEDLPLLYAAAQLFIYPSRYEGFGLPVLEAMACGTPVITSNASSLPELAGSAALQPDPTDINQLTEAIERLCGQESTRRELTLRGFDQVKKFTWHNTATQTLQAYRHGVKMKS
ncbi:MAG: glycosyltransferase family 4 protein [Anaerolineae bacterium]|nr:glycosyltransferase family 4 protein [Anaerolineae bacterium]